MHCSDKCGLSQQARIALKGIIFNILTPQKPVVTLITTRFNINNSTFCPQSAAVRFCGSPSKRRRFSCTETD